MIPDSSPERIQYLYPIIIFAAKHCDSQNYQIHEDKHNRRRNAVERLIPFESDHRCRQIPNRYIQKSSRRQSGDSSSHGKYQHFHTGISHKLSLRITGCHEDADIPQIAGYKIFNTAPRNNKRNTHKQH